MRLFVAVAVPAEVAGELDAAVAPLRAAWPALRWTRRDAWHLTLAFLGEVTEATSARLIPRLERAAARHPALSLSLARAGAFPSVARARVVWTGVEGDQRALAALADSVAAGARRAGVALADGHRRFRPHLTLARCREPLDARELVADLSRHAGPQWTAREIYLIRSYLPGAARGHQDRDNGRPRYETLGRWPLRVPATPAAPAAGQ
jgi:RNA 2',3'-cyclic 3'-phosphodiesterase